MVYSRILVAYDGSEMSDAALDHAAKFADAYDAELIILMVILTPKIPSLAFMSSSDAEKVRKAVKETFNSLKRQRKTMLEEKSNEIGARGIRVSKNLLVAEEVADGIISFARKKKVDLLVMGSVSLTGLRRLAALGSVSRKVSEQVHCPILIVHH